MYFLALSILEIVPSPKILCVTVVPVPTSARICSQSICGFSCFLPSTAFLTVVFAFAFALVLVTVLVMVLFSRHSS